MPGFIELICSPTKKIINYYILLLTREVVRVIIITNYKRSVRLLRKKRQHNSKTKAVQVGLWMPQIVKEEIKKKSAEEDCSMSWWVVENLLGQLGLTNADITEERGYDIPKTFTERKEDKEWSPNKKDHKRKKESKSKDTAVIDETGVERRWYYCSVEDKTFLFKANNDIKFTKELQTTVVDGGKCPNCLAAIVRGEAENEEASIGILQEKRPEYVSE